MKAIPKASFKRGFFFSLLEAEVSTDNLHLL